MGVAPDLSLTELPSFDLRDIITGVTSRKDQANEEALTSATFCKRPSVLLVNCNKRFDFNSNTNSYQTSRENILENVMQTKKHRKSETPNSRPRKSGFPCIVCKKKFEDKNEMKRHVRGRHLRPYVLCSVCGKRVFQDKLTNHFQTSCVQ